MNTQLFVATTDGVVVLEGEGADWRPQRRGLAGQRVTSVIARQGVVLAGTTDGVFRSDDLGQSWRPASAGLAVRHVRWLAYHPAVSDLEFAGTQPAAIFVSEDGAHTWRERPEAGRWRERYGWFLPYAPEAGCVRGFAFQGDRAYAAVEVGGVLRSDDRGQTWRLAGGSSGIPGLDEPPAGQVYPDVHTIAVHPTSPDLVYAPTGGGFYRSTDGGETWTAPYADCYCRAVWVDPADAEHVVLGPADYVDRRGRIEQTRDGGQTWQMASAGLEVPWPRGMVERFAQAGETLLAVLSNGALLAAPLATLAWRRIAPELRGVAAVTAMGGESTD